MYRSQAASNSAGLRAQHSPFLKDIRLHANSADLGRAGGQASVLGRRVCVQMALKRPEHFPNLVGLEDGCLEPFHLAFCT